MNSSVAADREVVKDPYYQKILAALDGPLDRDAFEECAVALLQDAYPGLIPIPGGSDAGMDGAIADGESEPYPLVVTTAKNVIGNLAMSLDSYVRHGGGRRRVVIATSQSLTAQRARNLAKKAREKGFLLVAAPHERSDIAQRLYRNSRWTRELLGITGDPPALSAVPRTRRPLPEIELVARDADLTWLRQTRGHRLVVGQPGSGKTALLLQLVREDNALFLASDDEARIAEAYRDSQPTLILADDAHLHPGKLDRLRQIRRDIGADFEIVASTWPGAVDEVADALGVGKASTRHLELLTRAEIIQVLRSIGIAEPDDDPYLRQLVDQSSNKPGLAVTLGSLWLRGEGIDVLTGRALRRSLIPALKRVLEHDPTRLLACFALGGDRGMSLDAVEEVLGLDRGEVHRQATLASQGGVLYVHRDQFLSVQPEVLRSALLSEVFFSPLPLHPYRELLDRAPSRGAAIETLAVAAVLGVRVPRDELRALLLEGGSRRAWQAFAALGESEGQWVLDNFQGSIAAIAGQLLDSAPRPTIRWLLQAAEGAVGPLHSHPSHPLRLLQDWVQDNPDPRHPNQIDAVQRRRIQVEEARTFRRQGGNRTVALRACFLALSPRLRSSRETATGGTVAIRQGILAGSDIPRMVDLWAEVLEEVEELTPESWSELEESLQVWAWPKVLGREPTQEESECCRDVARQIVSDLVGRAQGRPGFLLALKKWADRIELPLPLPDTEGFAVLFPLTDHLSAETRRDGLAAQAQAARELARRWASRPPQEVSRQLASYAAEAQSFGHGGSNAIWVFFRALADLVDAPEDWLRAFLKDRLPAHWLNPCFEKVVAENRPGWRRILALCLEDDDYAWLAGNIAIRFEGIPERLIDTALTKLPGDVIETACLRRQVPLDTLRSLLEHQRGEIAVAAAAGEWNSDPQGKVQPQIQAEWRKAVLRLGSAGGAERELRGQTYWLKEILNSDPDLAIAWLEAKVKSAAGYESVRSAGLYTAAIKPLSTKQRRELLLQLPDSGFSGRLIPLLVDESASLYRCLLAQTRLRQYHLVPLAGRPPDAAWRELALLGLKAGHEPQAIAGAAFSYEGGYGHWGIEHWGRWKAGFESLLTDAEGGLLEVARYGVDKAKVLISAGENEKRRFELTGEF